MLDTTPTSEQQSSQRAAPARLRYGRGDLGRRLLDGGWSEAHLGKVLTAAAVRHELLANPVLRPAGARPESYADVDLAVWDADGVRRLVSIKSSREAFTGPDDFPYPDCILMSVQAGQDWTRYWATVRVSVNEATKFGVVVAPHVGVFERWQRDRERGPNGEQYRVACVPRDVLRPWPAFVAALARVAVPA